MAFHLVLPAFVALVGCAGTSDTNTKPGTGGTHTNGGSGGAGATGGATGAGSGGGFGTGGLSGTGGATGTGGAGSGGTGTGGAATGGAGSGGAATGGRVGSGGVTGGTGGDGKAGTSGNGGGNRNCPADLLGWATVAGDGVSATTGGGTVTPVRPTTSAALMMLASDSAPRVIEISGSLNVPRLDVSSNKTLIGVGANATIDGAISIRGSAGSPVRNVIIRNLRINGAPSDVNGDAVEIAYAHHVWIDHCDIWDGPDGNLDISHASNWVTISWTKFRYTPAYQRPPGESADHRFSSLIGHSDNNADEDTGRLKVTFHHNWWAERVLERMPRVRFGQVHIFNNYFSSEGNHYCVRAGRSAQLLVEGNAFVGVDNPHEFNNDEDQQTANITARDNLYGTGTTGLRATGGGGPAFSSAPYVHTVEGTSGVASVVQSCAGPR